MLRSVVSRSEGAGIELPPSDVDAILVASSELHQMCIAAAGRAIRDGRLAELGLDVRAIDLVERSWNRRDPALIGRLDLAIGADGTPRLVGYSADAPVLDARSPVLRERLIARWRELRPRLGMRVHFAGDRDASTYLRDTAEQAGLTTSTLGLTDLRWEPYHRELVDRDGHTVHSIVKLEAWDVVLADKLAPVLPSLPTLWLEPAWKLVFANKRILRILAQLFPDHPNLVSAGDNAPVIHAWLVGDVPAAVTQGPPMEGPRPQGAPRPQDAGAAVIDPASGR